MDKGIFYLICSIIIVGVVISTAVITTSRIEALCSGHVVYQKQMVMATPSPTATPTATLKPVFKVVVTPSVVK